MAGDDPHRPLRADVRLLGRLLGETLRTHGGAGLFETVERVRMLSKASRAQRQEGKFNELASLLSELPVDSATPLARAFAHFLNLANVAEQHHRIRRRREDAHKIRIFGIDGRLCKLEPQRSVSRFRGRIVVGRLVRRERDAGRHQPRHLPRRR